MIELHINKIYNIDCLEFMKTLPDKCIDLIVTDPPYGIGAHNGTGKYGRLKEVGNTNDWDNGIPSKEYFDEIFRVSRNQIIFGGNYFVLPPSRCWLVWDKGEGFYNRDFAEVEMAWTSFDRNSKIFKYDPLAKGDYRQKHHPTMKPLEVIKWCIKQSDYWNTPLIIFDPFIGSGTTAVACKQMGRNYIGCELSKEYCDIAQKRLDSLTQSLF